MIKYKKFLDILTKNDFEAYLIGGCVRDILLDVIPSDYDIATNASPDEIAKLFKDYKVNFVGKSFGVTIVDNIEIATYRVDYYEGFNDKNVIVKKVNSIEEDLSRRDFTINAMAIDKEGRIIDMFNGRRDLENKIIRFVGNSIDRIKEDPNRIVRACRFVAKIDGEFDDNSFKAIKDYVDEYGISHIAPERIRKEILKSMEIEKASKFFISLHVIGLLRYIFPELDKCYGHDHGNYHQEDVFTHSMMTGDFIDTKNPLLKLAGYLHDIGKPQSYNREGKTFYEHHRFGEDIVKDDLTKLKFSNDEIKYISSLVRLHMIQDPEKDKQVRRIINRFTEYEVSYKDWMRLKIADRGANSKRSPYTLSEVKEIMRKFKNFKDDVYEFPKLPINGLDVMYILHLTPSKEVGNVLKNLLNYVIEHGRSVNNRNHLLEKIEKEGKLLMAYVEQQEYIPYE